MAEETRPMVLRSVNLSLEADERLRKMAFALRRPKSDLIRAFIDQGLRRLSEGIGENPSAHTIERITADLEDATFSAAERAAFDRDIQRLQQVA